MNDTDGHDDDGASPVMPPLAWIRTFEATVSAGGIRNAGRRLGMHHSVVSRQISQLEKWLEVALRAPDQHRFALTPAGQRYHDRIAAPLAEIAGATLEVMGQASDTPFRTWCSPGLLVHWLTSRMTSFRERFPNNQVELKPSEQPANLKTYEADANLYLHLDSDGPIPAEGAMLHHPIARPVAIIGASRELAARIPAIRSAADTVNIPLLQAGPREEWKLWFAMNGMDLAADRVSEPCWDPHLALEAARLGQGLLLGNKLFFERSFARGELVEIETPGIVRKALGTYVLSTRADPKSRPVLTAFRQFLRESMRFSEDAGPPQ